MRFVVPHSLSTQHRDHVRVCTSRSTAYTSNHLQPSIAMIDMASLNTSKLRRRGKGSARRNLFGPVDHVQTKKVLQNEKAKMRESDQKRWNFDFNSENPLPGKFQWERIPVNCTDVHRSYSMDKLPFLSGKLNEHDCRLPLLSPEPRPSTPENATNPENRVFNFGDAENFSLENKGLWRVGAKTAVIPFTAVDQRQSDFRPTIRQKQSKLTGTVNT